MRRHGVVPFGDGAALAAVDGSRRSAILAETGAHASHIIPVSVPSSTPGASEASRGAVASAVAGSIVAGKKQEAVAAVSEKTQVTGVKGSVAAFDVTSFAHVKGSVLTAKKTKAEKHAAKTADETAPAKSKAKKETAAASKSTASESGKSYTVAKGDTLFSIARKHSVDVAQLRDWNHLKNNNVKLGQALRIGNR